MKSNKDGIALCLDDLSASLIDYFPHTQGGSPLSADILLDGARVLVNSVRSGHDDLLRQFQRLHEMLNQLSATQRILCDSLKTITERLAPQRHHRVATQCEYVSATIEASLVNVSLLRAHAKSALYKTKSDMGGSNHTVTSAIQVSYRKLESDEMRMLKEQHTLACKLNEYELLLSVVDSDQGGFKQTVDDWSKVRQETEECINDLQRLGWTGD